MRTEALGSAEEAHRRWPKGRSEQGASKANDAPPANPRSTARISPRLSAALPIDHPLMSRPDSPSSTPTPPPPDWNAIARDADFKALVRRKLKLVVPATVFFVVYYFALPVGVGWFPDFMKQKVWGDVNIAYLFALSQFFMAWVLAFIYVVAAAGWDRSERSLLAKFGFTSEH